MKGFLPGCFAVIAIGITSGALATTILFRSADRHENCSRVRLSTFFLGSLAAFVTSLLATMACSQPGGWIEGHSNLLLPIAAAVFAFPFGFLSLVVLDIMDWRHAMKRGIEFLPRFRRFGLQRSQGLFIAAEDGGKDVPAASLLSQQAPRRRNKQKTTGESPISGARKKPGGSGPVPV